MAETISDEKRAENLQEVLKAIEDLVKYVQEYVVPALERVAEAMAEVARVMREWARRVLLWMRRILIWRWLLKHVPKRAPRWVHLFVLGHPVMWWVIWKLPDAVVWKLPLDWRLLFG